MTKQNKTITMKKIVLLLLLFTGFVKAQIVNIPDPNFKLALLTSQLNPIDTNFDGEIQLAEALNTTTITIPLEFGTINPIYSLEGINYFTNLTSLSASYLPISSLDISDLTNLVQLFVTNNELTSLDLSNNINLENIRCGENQITTLNISGLSNLKYLSCPLNQISNLDVANKVTLERLDCRNNQISVLDLTGLINLKNLDCKTNFITTLDIAQSPNLLELSCADNLLTELDVSQHTGLTFLSCGNTQLASVDVTNLSNLVYLFLYGNLQSSLNLTNLTNLIYLDCRNSQITSIDFSNNPNVNSFKLKNNLNLTTLSIKNGNPTLGSGTSITFDDSPNISFVCADDFNISAITNLLSNLNNNLNPNAVVNSYCSFVPGGDYNTITGTIRYDANNNGCNATDSTQSFVRMNINDGTNQGATFTNANGTYNFYTLAGSFTINPSVENPSFFTITPASATIPFANTNNNVATQNFCISANGVHPDLEIVVAPITPARPGFNATYRVVYKNKGNQTLSGTATLNYNETLLDFVSATAAPTSQSSGVLNWSYTNLLPFESRSYFVTLNVNTPTETPPVNIDDVLSFSSSITPVASDAFPLDNSFTLNQTVVGAFDPNDIQCLEGNVAPPSEIGRYLHYMVNFENTGNFAAENVVVKVDIDGTKYDINTLQMLNTSHPSYTRINGNKVEFIFEGINLEAAGGNPPVGGHGNVLFKIKSKNTLSTGDTVAKRANIFFDYNAPIITNLEVTTFQALNNSIFEIDDSVAVFPNPTNGTININSTFNIKTIELYDIQGRILETVLENTNTTTLDISSRQNGIYFLKINTKNGSKVEKIVKE